MEPGWVIGTECPFLLQLEDDIVAKPNYLSTMKNFALQQPSEEWMILEFSQLGFIGNVPPKLTPVPSGAGTSAYWFLQAFGPMSCPNEVVKYLDFIPPCFCNGICIAQGRKILTANNHF